jgi:hypothetical protein
MNIRRVVLVIAVGLAAFAASFSTAYAAFFQWSRQQPVKVVALDVTVLDPVKMKLFRDQALTLELTAATILELKVPKLKPPLDIANKSGLPGASAELYLKNEAGMPMVFQQICCPSILAPNTNAFLGQYNVHFSDINCCTIPVGEARKFTIRIDNLQAGIFEQQFSVVIGALGEQ